MRRGDAFKSKYLKTEDLNGKDHLLTVESVVIETIKGQEGDPDEDKAIIFFKNHQKGMVLNATNWDTLEEAYGEEADDWKNLPVTLYPTTTKFRGKKVACMRLRIPKGSEVPDDVKSSPPSDNADEPPPMDDGDIPF